MEGLPEPGGLRQAGEKAARPAGQRPGPQWAVLGRLQTATTSELPGSSVCARGHLRPFSSTSFSQTCPHTDSHEGSGINTDPSTDKPPDRGSSHLTLPMVSTLWGTLLAALSLRSVSRKHSTHNGFALTDQQPNQRPGLAVVTGHHTHRKAGKGAATGGPSVHRSSAFWADMQCLLSICVPEMSLSGTGGGRALLLLSPQPHG